MSLIISNNSTAFNVLGSYQNNIGGLQKSMGRLSRGTKSVTDDPAGIAISERMRGQYRASAKARANVDNGVSMLQTADSWLQKISDMLGRMGELTIEAGDGTKTTTDIANLQTEFTALQDEIARITSGTTAAAKYNGLYLFRGGDGRDDGTGEVDQATELSLQVGADVDQEISFGLTNLSVADTTAVFSTVTWGSVIDSAAGMLVDSDKATGMIAGALDHISQSRAVLGSKQIRLEETRAGLLAYEDNLRSAESKIRDIDVAKESTEMAKYQVLSQVANAMLAQANQLPSSAVRLIGG